MCAKQITREIEPEARVGHGRDKGGRRKGRNGEKGSLERQGRGAIRKTKLLSFKLRKIM